MFITCKDLLNIDIFNKGKLVAGANHLNRVITWPYMSRTLLLEEIFTGGEFVLVAETYVSYDEIILNDFIEFCYKKNVAGVMIFIDHSSKGLNAIPNSVIEKGNQLGIPIFEMPWDIKSIDIIKKISVLIIKNQIRNDNINHLIESIIFFQAEPNEDTYTLLKDLGYYENYTYTLARFHFANFSTYCEAKGLKNDSEIHSHRNFIKRHVSNLVNSFLKDVIICSHADTCMAVIPLFTDYSDSKHLIAQQIQKIASHIRKDFPQLVIDIVVSREYKSLTTLKAAVHETSNLINLCHLSKHSESIIHYKDIGLFKILLEVQNKEVLQHYYQSIMGNLIRYDKENDPFLINTLNVYLEQNCNLDETSEVLFIHKNSLRYRLKKIEEITGENLKSPKALSAFYVCSMIRQLLEITPYD